MRYNYSVTVRPDIREMVQKECSRAFIRRVELEEFPRTGDYRHYALRAEISFSSPYFSEGAIPSPSNNTVLEETIRVSGATAPKDVAALFDHTSARLIKRINYYSEEYEGKVGPIPDPALVDLLSGLL